jgi:hypothetical protein
MTTGPKRMVALLAERSSQQWVVRDPEGNFWLLPAVDDPWGAPTVLPDARVGAGAGPWPLHVYA